jgi:hypothetical protein
VDNFPPGFVRKEKQRIYWATRFEVKLKAVKMASLPDWTNTSRVLFGTQPSLTITTPGGIISPSSSVSWSYAPAIQVGSSMAEFGTAWISPQEDELIAYGVADIDVLWSLAVATTGALTKPKVEDVTFVEVLWD